MTLEITPEEKKVLETMASDGGTDLKTQKRALAVLEYLESADIRKAVAASGLSRGTVKKVLADFESKGWQGLLSVSAPRGGDFLAVDSRKNLPIAFRSRTVDCWVTFQSRMLRDAFLRQITGALLCMAG